MRPFTYERPATVEAAAAAAHLEDGAAFLAGGTTLVDLMKLDVLRPSRVIDIDRLDLALIEIEPERVRLGALVRMTEAERDERVRRELPAVAEALEQAASGQLRNRATLGGNLLQRTRCSWFRDANAACNKREPGSGCSALEGPHRHHAVLGTSPACIATYPGDLAVALVALDAEVETVSPRGTRTLPLEGLHRQPGETPEIETVLTTDELVTAISVPRGALGKASTYVKIRDRASYAFALASAAAALVTDGGRITECRLALGGVATVPWRAREAERYLIGRPLDEETAEKAARIAFDGAVPRSDNAYKIPLGIAAVIEALLAAVKRA